MIIPQIIMVPLTIMMILMGVSPSLNHALSAAAAGLARPVSPMQMASIIVREVCITVSE